MMALMEHLPYELRGGHIGAVASCGVTELNSDFTIIVKVVLFLKTKSSS